MAHTKHKPIVSENGALEKVSSSKAMQVQADEKPAKAHFERADKLFDAGKQDSAMIVLRYIVRTAGNEEKEAYFSALLLMAEIHRRARNFDSAYQLLQKTHDELSISLPDSSLIWANYYHKLGSLHVSQADYQKAISALEKSIEMRIHNAGNADTNLVNSYINLGLIYYILDTYNDALIYYNKAIQIIEKGEVRSKSIIAVCYQYSALNYALMGDFENAAFYFDAAKKQYEEYLHKTDLLWAKFYNNYASMLSDEGVLSESLEYYKKAHAILLQNYDYTHISVGLNLLHQAVVYSALYDYDMAYHYNALAINIFEQQYDASHDRVLTSYHNGGVYLKALGKYEQAATYLHKSINPNLLNSTNIMAYRNLGVLYHDLDQNEEAAIWFRKAMTGAIELYGLNHRQTAVTFVRYGSFLTDMGDFDQAHELLHQAARFLKDLMGASNRDYGLALFKWGANYLEQGNTKDALEVFQQAVAVFSPEVDSSDYLRNPDLEQLTHDPFLLNTIYLKARALHMVYSQTGSEKHLQAASQTYQLSIALLTEMRNAYSSDENRLHITRLTSEILSNAMDCAFEHYNHTPDYHQLQNAFTISEMGKAIVLLGMLHDLKTKQVSQLPEDIQTAENGIKHRMHTLEGFVRNERGINQPDLFKLNKWQTELILLKNREDSLMQAIHQQFPDYQAMKFDLPSTSLALLQSGIASDEAVLSYTLAENNLYVFAIMTDTAFFFRKQTGEGFFQLLETMRRQLSGQMLASYSIHDYQEYLTTAHELYRYLVEPVSQHLGTRKLIIVPDKQLAYLPFEALLTNKTAPATIDFVSLPYLFHNHVMRYAYTVTLDQYLHNRQPESTNNKMLALAPEYSAIVVENNNDTINKLMPLPWAVEEVKSLAKSYQTDVYVGGLANKQLFNQKAPHYKVLHLAMHATIDDENPMFSKLYFSAADRIEVLETHELYAMRLPAAFAFLGACNSGDGPIQKGEGVMSFARGFLYAGVQSLVMALWEVDDQTASRLVVSFYDLASKAYPLDEALQRAKQTYLATADNLKAHPYYWAGYIQLGDNEPISLQTYNPYRRIAYMIIGLIMLLAGVVYMLKRKKLFSKHYGGHDSP
ncbi:MAG: CHAT domain-containing protein [Bacteroidales bacterium]|nr:CHAT domain-containing protein [Bacteroidales bacterium]MDY0086510.1 CHAT domain-containing protein [Bacteroidales bacterium]